MDMKPWAAIDRQVSADYGVNARKDWIFNQLEHYIKVHP